MKGSFKCTLWLSASRLPPPDAWAAGTRIPLGYIFESNVVEILLRLFPQPAFRNLALQCLSEVRARSPPPRAPSSLPQGSQDSNSTMFQVHSLRHDSHCPSNDLRSWMVLSSG